MHSFTPFRNYQTAIFNQLLIPYTQIVRRGRDGLQSVSTALAFAV